MSDVALTLGDLVFDPSFVTHEMPDKIGFGGAQRLGVHQLPGGVRIIDAMGPDDHDIAWSGMFFGPGATERGLYLDRLRKQGAPAILSWDAFQYQVVVETVKCDFEREYQVPYEVTCKIITDLANPISASSQPGVDSLVSGDMTNILSAAQSLGMTVIGALPGPFSTTLGSIVSSALSVLAP